MEKELKEIEPDFYDSEYTLNQERRYLSGAIGSRVRNVLSMIGDLSGKQLLDIGCGGGFLANEFYKKGAKVTGIDYSAASVNLAKERFPHIDFSVAAVGSLGAFRENQFDAVSLLDVIEHVNDQEKALREIKRILKPSGFFIVSTDLDGSFWEKMFVPKIINFTQRFSKEGRAYRAIKKAEAPRRQFKNYHKGHCNLVNFEELEGLLEKENFKIIEHEVYPLVGVPARDIFLRFLPKKYRGDHQCILCKNEK